MTRRAAASVLLLAGASFLAGCASGPPSTAADRYISKAAGEEEKQALIEARDDIDEEMRPLDADRDAEIARLEKENAELRTRVEARRKNP